jgi:hypothetical protein
MATKARRIADYVIGLFVNRTNGNVGIGTSDPIVKLQVRSPTASQVYVTEDSTGITAQVAASAAGAIYGSFTDHPTQFRTNNIERMRLDISGNLLVGTISTSGAGGFPIVPNASNGSAQVLINRTASANASFPFVFNNGGSAVGSISYNNATTVYSTSSDYRLKHDIQPMADALAKVAQLKPCTYKWNADESQGEGFIAHELQQVVPECVTGQKDAVDADGNPVYQGIDTSFLVATLTAAMQEQQAIIEQLKARVEALENA